MPILQIYIHFCIFKSDQPSTVAPVRFSNGTSWMNAIRRFMPGSTELLRRSIFKAASELPITWNSRWLVTNCLENLEMSETLTDIRKMSGGSVREKANMANFMFGYELRRCSVALRMHVYYYCTEYACVITATWVWVTRKVGKYQENVRQFYSAWTAVTLGLTDVYCIAFSGAADICHCRTELLETCYRPPGMFVDPGSSDCQAWGINNISCIGHLDSFFSCVRTGNYTQEWSGVPQQG